MKKYLVTVLLLLPSLLFAAQTSIMPMPRQQFFDNSGHILAGGKIYTCQPGTVCGPSPASPKATYTDSSGTAQNANPVVLDSAGRASIWLSGYYKIALYTATGTLLYTQDNVSSVNASASTTSLFYDTTALSVTKDLKGLSEVYVTKTDGTANTVTLIDTGGSTFLQKGAYAFGASYVMGKGGESVHMVLSGGKWYSVGAQSGSRGVLVYNVTGAAGVQSWASEVYDTDNIHENVTHPSRLTVPAGVTKVRMHALVWFNSAAGQAEIIKNANGTYPGRAVGTVAAGQAYVPLNSPELVVVGGDYFEIDSFSTTTATDTGGYNSWFMMDIIE